MAQASYKNPPALCKDTVYETWKTEIEIWRRVTDLEKKRQALAVTLTLTDQARAKALEIDVSDLNADDGLDKLLLALDSLFLKDVVDLAYEAYSRFDSFRKTPEMTMSDFILEFEHLYGQCKKHEMPLPEAVLTFKMLDSAGLTGPQRQLALTAASDLKVASMKSALKRIFADHDKSHSDFMDCGFGVKSETVYATERSFKGRPRQNYSTNKYSGDSSVTPKGTNPLNRFGKRTKCVICQSVFHWAKDCPHKSSSSEVQLTDSQPQQHGQCNLTLFTNESSQVNTVLMTECFGCAVIDTACSRTVCGKNWLDNYMSNLSGEQLHSVITKPSCQPFRFGDGAEIKSFKNCVIPAVIGEQKCQIDVEVIDGDLPLLLSKDSLKRAETVLDLSKDRATMFHQPVQLQFTSSGHYCVDLQSQSDGSNVCDLDCMDEVSDSEVLIIDSNMTADAKQKVLIKLHKQFGHASAERLQKLLKSAGDCDNETSNLLTDIVSNCDICLQYKKQPTKPAVGLPLATDFNETVALDLHQLDKNVWYLHIIDEFTRFSAGAIITNKHSTVIVQKFLQHWVSIHGAPLKVYSDNGGEFNNQIFHDMCENLNIIIKITPAMSPWSNGLLERHNFTLTEILLKVKAENQCDWNTALSWALMAKNCLASVHGYSAHQLVYGRNPNLPSVLTDKAPALEGTPISDLVGKHISAIHSARKAFIQAESSERIRRALRKQVRSFTGTYFMGEKVYYKRPDNNKWKGPATVIGQDGAVIFARHGGMIVRVHQCRLRKLEGTELSQCASNMTDIEAANNSEHSAELARKIHVDSNLEFCVNDLDTDTCDRNTGANTDTSNASRESTVENAGDFDISTNTLVRPSCINLKEGELVFYKHSENGDIMSARVISRAGKVKGKNCTWYNLEYLSPDYVKGVKQSVDLNLVDGLEINQNQNESDSQSDSNENSIMIVDLEWRDAKLKELECWKRNVVFEAVPAKVGQKCVSTRWVCTAKEGPDGIVRKARLVARGFEEIKDGSIQTDSPTCSKESLRLILALAAQNSWKAQSMDIKTAFLQGQPIDREVFVYPPKEAECSVGIVWQLKKCVYGLNDASLTWYKTVKSVMTNCGAKISKVDPAVFYWCNDKGQLIGFLASHVDDFIWSGNSDFERIVVQKIRSKLNVGKEDSEAFQYVGIELLCNGTEIQMHQNKYGESITPIWIEKSRSSQKQSPLNSDERQTLRSKIGQLLWIAHQTRPDIIFDVCQLASCLKESCVENILEANKIIKRVKSEKLTLKFQNLGCGSLSLVVFSDSSLGNLPDGGTQGGHLIVLASNDGTFSPVCWNSKKIRRVVRSSLAGETLAMADAVDTGIFLSTLYSELTTGTAIPRHLPLVCVTDCRSLYEAIKSTKPVTEKRLRLEISGIKELVEKSLVKQVLWSETGKQLADCLTKRGASPLMLLQALESGKLPQCLTD